MQFGVRSNSAARSVSDFIAAHFTHSGHFYAFRSFLYGRDVWIASQLQSASAKLLQSHENGIFVTGAVRSELSGTPSHNRFQRVRLRPLPRALAGVEVYRLCNEASD